MIESMGVAVHVIHGKLRGANYRCVEAHNPTNSVQKHVFCFYLSIRRHFVALKPAMDTRLDSGLYFPSCAMTHHKSTVHTYTTSFSPHEENMILDLRVGTYENLMLMAFFPLQILGCAGLEKANINFIDRNRKFMMQ